jgi:hypothetical protein
MDPVRRNILATGAAAAATAAAPHVFAQQVGQGGAFKFYEKGDVLIRYQEVGSGFPLLVTPGGRLNSRISNWATAVFNAMEDFKSGFQRLAVRYILTGVRLRTAFDCAPRKLISINGSSVLETANRLHMTEGAVRVALNRALRTLAAPYRGSEFGIGSAVPFTAALKQCG